MCDAIVHRGPDDEGFYVRAGVALGMRRLSIIDVAGGHQPIHNEDETVWTVFNGEIYNYPELRQELESKGHRFYTNSDTECLVHLYEEYGSAFVSHLRGMFAYAIYDENSRKLLIGRDRLGKKPLHYALVGNTFLFGSEIKSLLIAAPELAEKNEDSLAYYFSFGYIPDPLTAYKSVSKLLPGHTLEFSHTGIQISKYWELSACGSETGLSDAEVLEQLDCVLSEAVKVRLLSDVPLGAFLSGGVDSSLVVGMMARHSRLPVQTFSITFENEAYNEAAYAKQVALAFGTQHTEFVVQPKAVSILEKISHMLEEPFADSSLIPTYLVSELARQHVTVALTGDGGDELFAGYERYSVALRRSKYRTGLSGLRKFYRNHVFCKMPNSFPARNLLYNLSLSFRDAYIHGLTLLSPKHTGVSVLSPDFLSRAKQVHPEAMFAEIFDTASAGDDIDSLQMLDIKTYLVGDILTKVDRMTMAASLEARSPLLDHRFVETALRLPAKWRIHQREQKYILKKLAEKVGVPRDVLYRRKRGFAVPLIHWLRKELRDLVYSVLLDARAIQRGYFNRIGVDELLREHMRGRRDHSSAIFQLLMFELWHRNFLESPLRTNEHGTPHRNALNIR